MVRDIEVVQDIWGKNIDKLKGNTTRTKTNGGRGYYQEPQISAQSQENSVSHNRYNFYEWDTIFYLTQPQD